MTTIDQLDISVYNLYAVRTKMIEQTNLELRLQEAATIPPQTTLFDTSPKMSDLDLLIGTAPVVTPWAFIYPPKKFRRTRRSPFARYRIAPSLGSLEQQEEDEALIASIPTGSKEEEEEKEALLQCLEVLGRINGWINFVVGRIGQFLQG